MYYIIWKLIKTSGLCNPESNHASEKSFLDYIIQKLIINLKMTSRLSNPEYYRGIFLKI